MRVTLNKLKLFYFKGIKALDMDFSQRTNIHGKNEAGKTTLFDSLWYLFFGKDSQGKADFPIKTVDANNNPIERVDHEVHGFFEVDGVKRDFKRTYLQKWDKKTDTLKGHTTEFAIDGFPVATKTDYDKQVSEFFTEETFKVVTNPLFFNSLKTDEKRAILLKLVPQITDTEILEMLKAENPKDKSYQALEDILAVQKDFSAIKLKAQRDRKALQEEKERIPQRIDENMRNMPDQEDWEALEGIVSAKTKEISSIDKQISDVTERNSALNKMKIDAQNQVFDLKRKVAELENDALTKARDIELEARKELNNSIRFLNDLKNEKVKINQSISDTTERIEKGKAYLKELEERKADKQSQLTDLRQKFSAKQSEQFTLEGNCPYCGTELAQVANYGAEKESEFNQAKVKALEAMNNTGKQIKDQLEAIEKDIAAATAKIEKLQAEKAEYMTKLEAVAVEVSNLEAKIKTLESSQTKDLPSWESYLTEEHAKLLSDIKNLEEKDFGKPDGIEELTAKKNDIQAQINSINLTLHKKATIEQLTKRNEELNQELKSLSAKIVEAEGLEKAIKAFSVKRINLVDEALNAKFRLVKWKMFEQNLSNDDVTEICECLYKGVPWNGLNNAGRIQAGLDIIRTFNEAYNLYLPVFIDNRESVTNIPDMDTQIINLIVDPNAETLTIK